ncbi:MAG: ATP--guanido phosphotransferase [Lachnospiraceae bacterium]|nr:ATP--guanido phosphotransferase [Lachnospiraceae bacterium]
MTKWYEETDQMHDVFVMKRLRLVRNVAGHIFPSRLRGAERQAMLSQLETDFVPMETEEGQPYAYCRLDELDETSRNALYERRVINYSRVEDGEPSGLLLSPDEALSLVLNGEDHLRLQYLSGAQSLENMLARLMRLEDTLGEKAPFAFDEKYGYLTTFLTNVGTGLRASVVVHLPMLSNGSQFRKLVQEYSRFGISVKGLSGDSNENYGGLFEVKNQKTLGQTEEELIGLVSQAANQLATQERKVKSLALRSHRLQIEDEIYKSYGVLKYARKLTYKEGMTYLSQLRMGLCENLVQAETPVNVFGIMLNIRPANLKKTHARDLEGDALDEARAKYIQAHLPKLQ